MVYADVCTVCMQIVTPYFKQIIIILNTQCCRSDGKVAPGSNAVKRHLDDERFLLSSAFLLLAQLHLLHNHSPLVAITAIRKSLVWFPRSIRGNLLLAQLLKPFATDELLLQQVEIHLSKAFALAKELSASPPSLFHDAVNVDAELSCQDEAGEELALLLLQQGKEEEAGSLLLQLGFTWRLSSQVLAYTDRSKILPNPTPDAMSIARVWDDAFNPSVISHLNHVFRASSPFWSEHDYDMIGSISRKSGYFSYLYPFKTRPSLNSIETVIDALYTMLSEHFPALATDCNYGTSCLLYTILLFLLIVSDFNFSI